ncbi:MAG: hypothetical protein Q9195_000721 [Heterodermia aff. obscurata]
MAPPPANPQAITSARRTEAIILAHTKITKYCNQLVLPSEVRNKAEGIYKQAYDANLKRKNSLRAFLTACIFLACRQEHITLYLATMITKIDASIPKTVEALWYLENFLVDGTAVRPDEITVTCELSDSYFSLYLSNRPSVEVHLTWPEDSRAVVMGDLFTRSPSLREIRARRTVLAKNTLKEAELPKEIATIQDDPDEKEAGLPKEIATIQDDSDEKADHYEIVDMDEDLDWEKINWEDELKADINTDHKTEKTAKAKGWAGALRRGIFG